MRQNAGDVKKGRGESGFLLMEVLIAGLIVTAAVAAAMALFREGMTSLQRARESNLVASKVPEALDYLKFAEMVGIPSTEELGDEVVMTWKSTLLRVSPPFITPNVSGKYDVYLYRVNFTLTYRDLARDYEINLLRCRKKETGAEAG
ncbi:MAG: hypothetical protein HQK89_07155 [Nitrospirae bacterium]|nr:hypothetical protein [Nitrospirota bacterium]